LAGKAVVVEISNWPLPTQNPRGRLIEILVSEHDFCGGLERTTA